MKLKLSPKWLFLLLPLVLASSLSADIVHLKKGGSLEGQLTDQGDQVKLEFPGGSLVIKKTDISRIERKATPQNIFAGRLKKATTDQQKQPDEITPPPENDNQSDDKA